MVWQLTDACRGTGNEACSKRRTLPSHNFPFQPLAAAAVPAAGLGAAWTSATACAPLPDLKQDEVEDVSQGGVKSEEAGRETGSRMGMLTRAAAAMAAQGTHAGLLTQNTFLGQAGPSHRSAPVAHA